MSFYYKYGETELLYFSYLNEVVEKIYSLNNYSQIFICTDEIIFKLYREQFDHSLKKLEKKLKFILTPSGEASKSIEQTLKLWSHLSTYGADRHSLLISLGGGVVNDMTGFIASTYMRGIDYISIPTTLLCMVDASIGGKVGINFSSRKNLIGSFYHPKAIFICDEFLNTLPPKEFSSGFAEIIKAAVISGDPFFSKLENSIHHINQNKSLLKEIIFESCKTKIDVITSDPYEKNGNRSLLNYGHTFGHAIEDLTDFQIKHGEAVSIGMSCAAYVAKNLKFIDKSWIERQDSLCSKAKLPTDLPEIDIYDLVNQLKKDKKNFSEKITLILPQKIGKVINLPNISETIILESLLEKKEKDVFNRT